MTLRLALAASTALLLSPLPALAQTVPAPAAAAAQSEHEKLFALFDDADARALALDPMGRLFRGEENGADRLGDLLTDSSFLASRTDTQLNLARLAPPSTEADPPKESGPLPDIRIATLAVEAGRVGFEDRSRPQPFATELKPIEFALSRFRTQPGYENDYRFSASSKAGETLAWRGRFTVQPLGSEGEFSMKNLLATTLGDYLQQRLPLRLAGGALDLEGRYRFALQPALELSLDLPTLRLREFAVSAHGSRETPVRIREVAVDALAFSLARREVSVQRVGIDGAQIDVRRAADGSINLQSLLSPSAPACSRR